MSEASSFKGEKVFVVGGANSAGQAAIMLARHAETVTPFFTTKPPGSGTGLGLSISRRIVALDHGGELAVDSEPGRTVFRARIPISRL